MIQIESFEIKDIPVDAVNEFLSKVGNQLVYYSIEYNEFLERSLSNSHCVCLISFCQEKVVGLFWIHVCENTAGEKVANSLPFFGGHGGPLVDHLLDHSEAVAKELILEFNSYCRINNIAACLVVENMHRLFDSTVWENSGLVSVDRRIGQQTKLPSGSGLTAATVGESLFDIFHVKTRNAVRKGLKFPQTISVDSSTTAWTWLEYEHAQSIIGLGGVPKSERIFNEIRTGKVLHRLYTGSSEGEYTCALLVLLYKETVEYFTPVNGPDYRNSQVLPALIFHAMQELTLDGYKFWNWGGTWESQEGVYRFKSRFGAKDTGYQYLGKVFDDTLLSYEPAQLRQYFPYYYALRY